MPDVKLSDLYTNQNANCPSTCDNQQDECFVEFRCLPVGNTDCTVAPGSHKHDDRYIRITEKSVAHGVASLDALGKIFFYQIPFGTVKDTVAAGDHTHTDFILKSVVGSPHGIPSLDSSAKIPTHFLPEEALRSCDGMIDISRLPVGTTCDTVAAGDHNHDFDYAKINHDHDTRYVRISEKGAIEGVAPLDCNRKIPLCFLPEEIVTAINNPTIRFDMLPVGTTPGTVAAGNHNHDEIYYRKSFIDTELRNIYDNAPAVLNSIGKLAAALCNDPNFCHNIYDEINKKLDRSAYTPQDVLSKIRQVHGEGSLLDADLLDGRHGSYYLDPKNFTDTIPLRLLPELHCHTTDAAEKLFNPRRIQLSGPVTGWTMFDGSSDVVISTFINPSEIANQLNFEGIYLSVDQKAVDSDRLDGFDSSYFLNASNLATGTIPLERLPASVRDGSAETAERFRNPVTLVLSGDAAGSVMIRGDEPIVTLPVTIKNLTDTNLLQTLDDRYLLQEETAVNSLELDGRPPSYYLDAANIRAFTGRLPLSIMPTNFSATASESAVKLKDPLTIEFTCPDDPAGNPRGVEGFVTFSGDEGTIQACLDVKGYQHNHDTEYLAIDGTAENSNKLCGHECHEFVLTESIFNTDGTIKIEMLPPEVSDGGHSDEADKLATPRNFRISGLVETAVPVAFDGSQNVNLVVTSVTANKLELSDHEAININLSGDVTPFTITIDGNSHDITDVEVARSLKIYTKSGSIVPALREMTLEDIGNPERIFSISAGSGRKIPAEFLPTSGFSTESAAKLTTPHTFNFEGDVVGSLVGYDGSLTEYTINLELSAELAAELSDNEVSFKFIGNNVTLLNPNDGDALTVRCSDPEAIEFNLRINRAVSALNIREDDTASPSILTYSDLRDASLFTTGFLNLARLPRITASGINNVVDITARRAVSLEGNHTIRLLSDVQGQVTTSFDGVTPIEINTSINWYNPTTNPTGVRVPPGSIDLPDGEGFGTASSLQNHINLGVTGKAIGTLNTNLNSTPETQDHIINVTEAIATDFDEPIDLRFGGDVRLSGGATTVKVFRPGDDVLINLDVTRISGPGGNPINVSSLLTKDELIPAFFNTLTIADGGITYNSEDQIREIIYSNPFQKNIDYDGDGDIERIRYIFSNNDGNVETRTQTFEYMINPLTSNKVLSRTVWS